MVVFVISLLKPTTTLPQVEPGLTTRFYTLDKLKICTPYPIVLPLIVFSFGQGGLTGLCSYFDTRIENVCITFQVPSRAVQHPVAVE